jgi:hypothetical protein
MMVKRYKDAAEQAQAADLKSFFRQQASDRFADQLEAELGRLGEQTKKDSGHVTGTLRRAWIERQGKPWWR